MYWVVRISGIASFSAGIVGLICTGICLTAMLIRREVSGGRVRPWLIAILSALTAALAGCICMRHAGIGTDGTVYLTPDDLYAAGISVFVSAMVILFLLRKACGENTGEDVSTGEDSEAGGGKEKP